MRPAKRTGARAAQDHVRVTDIRDGRIATGEPLRVSRVIEAAYARTRLRGGELLLTLVGTVGEAAVVPHSLAG
jgi:type I restriction enzyme S subunit